MDERNIEFKKIETKYNNAISELEKKRKALPKEQKQKIEEIEKSIEKLKTEKELFKSRIDFTPSPVPANFDFSNISVLCETNFHRCSHCGFGFKTENLNLPMDQQLTIASFRPFGSPANIACPKCGNVDQIY